MLAGCVVMSMRRHSRPRRMSREPFVPRAIRVFIMAVNPGGPVCMITNVSAQDACALGAATPPDKAPDMTSRLAGKHWKDSVFLVCR